jgi:tetratricopeptide (TPR) repeat protein
MSQDTAAASAHFENLKNRWRATIEAGRLEEAAVIIADALAWARDHGDAQQTDSAVCAGASVAIQLGRGEAELARLREILLRSGDPAICWLAAYPISLHYELTKNYKKSLFYARLTRDRAEIVGRPDWLAYSHNQIGNALLGESFVPEACVEYEKALELMPERPSVWRAVAQRNLGYCLVLQRRFREGYTLLYQSLKVLRRFQALRYEVSTRLDLCFAHLETERYSHARRQGEEALRLAEKTDQPEAIKNALYLLGETESLSGTGGAAHSYFSRLQKEFFPDASYLPAFLMTVDVRKLVNLHA